MVDQRSGNLKYSELTAKIIGCAIEVHNILGVGFQEIIYQKALALELKAAGMNYVREYDMDIFYKGIKVGIRRVDFFIENII